MFIELTLKNTDQEILININHIENIMEDGEYTLVCFNSGESIIVKETYKTVKSVIKIKTGEWNK